MLRYQEPTEGTAWSTMAWYVALGLLVVAVLAYAELSLKVYLQTKQLGTLNGQIASAVAEHRQRESDVLAAKKNIDTFVGALQHHTIASGVIKFIENNTLPEVVLASVTFSEPMREIRLSGRATTMSAFSRQVQLFEKNKIAVSKVNVVDSSTDAKGVVAFSISLDANPDIFLYPIK